MKRRNREFFIQTDLVILGSGILIDEILKAGAYGVGQALLVVGVVWYVCYWLAVRMKADEKFAAVLASSVSICGVSAAIAIWGAIKGDPKKLSYVTSRERNSCGSKNVGRRFRAYSNDFIVLELELFYGHGKS